jgi:hypothetical protein
MPGPPIVGALLMAAALVGAYLAFQYAFGLRVHRMAILLLLMIAYMVMVPGFFAFRQARERRELGHDVPVAGRRETEAWALSLPRDTIRRSRVAGAVGAIAFFWLDAWIAWTEGVEFPDFWLTIHGGTTTIFAVTYIGWFLGRAVYFTVMSPPAIRLPDPPEVDLLHLDGLHAIGRTGLRDALLWLVGMSIGSLFFLESVVGWWGLVPVFVAGLIIGGTVLLRPAQKVRRVIRAAKRAELERLEPKIRQARDDALGDDPAEQGRLTDLLAYQDRVAATTEWSFNSSTMWRFVLYLFIPVASMVAGVLVERVVEGMLESVVGGS